MLLSVHAVLAQQPAARPTKGRTSVVEIEGTVQVSRAGSNSWEPAQTNQWLQASDRLRTGERSRAVIRLSDLTTKRLGEQTIIQIPPASPRGAGFNLLKGLLYYFHRDKPGVFPVQTPSAYAVVLGTEFAISVADNGQCLWPHRAEVRPNCRC